MSSLTFRNPNPSLTLTIPNSGRRFESLSSPPLPSSRHSPFGLDPSHFGSVTPKRTSVSREIKKEVQPLDTSNLKEALHRPPSISTLSLENLEPPNLSSTLPNFESVSLPSFEDEVSVLIKAELQRTELHSKDCDSTQVKPRLVNSVAVGIFLPIPLDCPEFNHHALLLSLESQDPTRTDRIHSDGLGPVEAGGFRFSHQVDAYRHSRGIQTIVELNLGPAMAGKTDQDIKSICERVPLPCRPYTSCQDYLIWLLVTLEARSLLAPGEVARFVSLGFKGHIKPVAN